MKRNLNNQNGGTIVKSINKKVLFLIRKAMDREIDYHLEPDTGRTGREVSDECEEIEKKLRKGILLTKIEENHLVGMIFDSVAQLTYQKMYYGVHDNPRAHELPARMREATILTGFLEANFPQYWTEVTPDGHYQFIKKTDEPPLKDRITLASLCTKFIENAKNLKFYYINGEAMTIDSKLSLGEPSMMKKMLHELGKMWHR